MPRMSDFERRDFLDLRILHQPVPLNTLIDTNSHEWTSAQKLLADSSEVSAVCALIKEGCLGPSASLDEGTTPGKFPSDNRLNTKYILSFLDALCSTIGAKKEMVHDETWVLGVPRPGSNGEIMLTTSVDGFISEPPDVNDDPLKIFPVSCAVKTTRELRSKDIHVRMQEDAAMALFVCDLEANASVSNPLAMATLNGYQAGLSFAFYDSGYVDYLSGDQPEYDGFMVVKELETRWDLRESDQILEWMTFMVVLIRRAIVVSDSAVE